MLAGGVIAHVEGGGVAAGPPDHAPHLGDGEANEDLAQDEARLIPGAEREDYQARINNLMFNFAVEWAF